MKSFYLMAKATPKEATVFFLNSVFFVRVSAYQVCNSKDFVADLLLCSQNIVLNKTENHFSHYPRSRINLYTRLKIAMYCGENFNEPSAGKRMQ
jgi:hypothetical protein